MPTVTQEQLPTAEVEARFAAIAREISGVAIGDCEKNQRFEVITDLAERVGYPIDIIIPYLLRDGELYALSDMRDRPFTEQTAEAVRRGVMFTGNQAFERERLQYEHEEALLAEQLARGELAGNVMIKISRVPDAVARGETDIQGYRRDLLRSFVRVYWRTKQGVACRLFTLDHNNQAGLERVGQLVGIAVVGNGSEDTLALTGMFDVPEEEVELFVEGLVSATKCEYDAATLADTGRVTHAGSDIMSEENAHELVAQQVDLVDNLMKQLVQTDSETTVEALLQRTAAAISLRARGYIVTDASVSAEVSSGDYGRECPTASNGMNQANQEALKDWKKQVKECPLCHKRNVMAEKKGEIITDLDNGCWLNVCTGEKFIPKSASEKDKPIVTKENAASIKKAAEKEAREKLIKKKYGIWAFELTKRSKEDGKLHNFIYHRWTGKLLADSGRVAAK